MKFKWVKALLWDKNGHFRGKNTEYGVNDFVVLLIWHTFAQIKHEYMSTDEYYIHRCLSLAQLGGYYVAPNPMVGAVLVSEQMKPSGMMQRCIIGEGWHRQYGEAHAEVNCFLDAERRGYTNFRDCTLYVSLEPCSHFGKTPPCARLIIEKGVRRVVAGMRDPNPQVAGKGLKMLQDAGIEVTCGVLEEECRALNKRFLCLHERHRPYVILKWAQSADGFLDRSRTSLKTDGQPVLLSNAVTKQLVHQMRAENMAIMVGTNTAVLDNPRLLTTRWSGRNPIRVVLDRHGRIPADSRIFSMDSETIVYREQTDFPFVLSDLANRGIHSLLVEGGAALLRHILETGLYDEIHVETSHLCLSSGVPAPSIPAGVRREHITQVGTSILCGYLHNP